MSGVLAGVASLWAQCPSCVLAVALPLLFVLYTFWVHRRSTKENPLVWSWVPHLRSSDTHAQDTRTRHAQSQLPQNQRRLRPSTLIDGCSSGLSFGTDPNTFLANAKKQYGPVFSVNLGPKRMTFVTDPFAYPQIVKSREGLSFSVVANEVGMNVLAQSAEMAADTDLDVEVHKQYAKGLSGAGLDEITVGFQTHLTAWLDTHCQRHREACGNTPQRGGLLDLVTRVIFSSATRALFGDMLVDSDARPQPFGATFTDDFMAPKTLLSTFQSFDKVFPLLYGGMPHFLLRKGVDARDALMRTLRTLRPNACGFFNDRHDLMVANPLHPRPALDAKDFGASQLGFLWAAHGNTIPASFWLLFFLMQNPEQMALVRAEMDPIVAESRAAQPKGCSPFQLEFTRDQLKRMVVLDAAISECLRMATGSMMLRRVVADLTLDLPTGPLSFKAGDNIALYPWLAHHDSSIFPNPDQFRLQRFLGTAVESGTVVAPDGRKVPNAYLPFGAGSSMCPGRNFARNEIKIFTAVFLSLFDITPVGELKNPGYLLERAGLGIFPPASDVQVEYKLKA